PRDGFRSDRPRPPRSDGGGFRGDRPPPRDGFRSDRPRPPRSDGGGFRGDRPPPRDGFRSDRPRPPRSDGGGFRGDRPPPRDGFRSDRPRPPRSDGGGFRSDRPSRPPRDDFRSDRPRPPRSDGGGFRNDRSERPDRARPPHADRAPSEQAQGQDAQEAPQEFIFSKTGKPHQKVNRWSVDDPANDATDWQTPLSEQQETPQTQEEVYEEEYDNYVAAMPIPGSEKIQKILADTGMGSRRQMETFLLDGRVEVNGIVANLGARAMPEDRIQVDGKTIARGIKEQRILMYYKPVGKEVTREEGSDSVFDDLPAMKGNRWMNIGRLDINSEGLLLFSTDGNWVHQMTHPSGDVEREYRARVSGALSSEMLADACQNGIDVGDDRPIVPKHFVLERESEGMNCWYRIVLGEGRNRAIRRIFEYYDLQVSRLIRVRYGDYKLPLTLKPGEHHEVPPADKK
ncbi:MAG: pseudouridine synthase, partial [Proteobacteria bacterium]|nr:pseudouridine synthase [Pseudomonadota bacterium]